MRFSQLKAHQDNLSAMKQACPSSIAGSIYGTKKIKANTMVSAAFIFLRHLAALTIFPCFPQFSELKMGLATLNLADCSGRPSAWVIYDMARGRRYH